MKHYFIDGYNLLFRFFKKNSSLEKQRLDILIAFNEIAVTQNLNLTFVFDASLRKERESSRGHFGNLEIIYTADNESADEYILRAVNEMRDPSTEVVVTSDRELATRCHHLGAQTQSIEKFLSFLKKKKRRKKIASSLESHKAFVDSEANIQRLLKIFEEKLLEGKGD
jgi:uncharacterized protein